MNNPAAAALERLQKIKVVSTEQTAADIEPTENECVVCKNMYADIEDARMFEAFCSQHWQEWTTATANRLGNRVLPTNLKNASLKSFGPQVQKVAIPNDRVDSVFITGPAGAGKSHLAAALLLRNTVDQLVVHRRVEQPVWLNVPIATMETIADLSGGVDPSGRWQTALDAPLLVLDDLGYTKPSEWVRIRLYTLLERRYGDSLKTIITSNQSLGQLATLFGGNQITSRISGLCRTIDFSGLPDQRVGR